MNERNECLLAYERKTCTRCDVETGNEKRIVMIELKTEIERNCFVVPMYALLCFALQSGEKGRASWCLKSGEVGTQAGVPAPICGASSSWLRLSSWRCLRCLRCLRHLRRLRRLLARSPARPLVHLSKSSHFPTQRNQHVRGRFFASGARVLDLAHDVHAINDLTENHVLVVQKRSRHGGDEELAAVGIGAGVLARRGTCLSAWRSRGEAGED